MLQAQNRAAGVVYFHMDKECPDLHGRGFASELAVLIATWR
jgi:hypothetical protein